MGRRLRAYPKALTQTLTLTLSLTVAIALPLTLTRCEWGGGFATTPTEMSATRVRCASYLHAAPAERRLQLSLNTVDYTPLAPLFGY